jgi:hypothetical protein
VRRQTAGEERQRNKKYREKHEVKTDMMTLRMKMEHYD